MYVSTGSHFFVVASSNGTSSRPTLGYRRKYHALSRNVSDTSVSRRAIPLHDGHGTRTHSACLASGDNPESSGLKSSTYGSSTGKPFSGTGPLPHLSQ